MYASRVVSRGPASGPRLRAPERLAPSQELAAGPVSERLQKVLAAAGIGSRRQCEELITTGRVEVDRQTVTELGSKVDPAAQEIRVDGERLPSPKRVVYMLNKPVGVVTTNYDPSGRPRVVDLLPADRRLFAIGRLDRSSEGLILVTNDPRATQIPMDVEGRVVAEVTVSPQLLALGAVPAGETVTKNVVIRANREFKITGVFCSDGCLTCEPKTTAARVHILPVTFQAGDVVGKVERELRITTDMGEGAVPVVTVQAQVEAVATEPAAEPTTEQAASLP